MIPRASLLTENGRFIDLVTTVILSGSSEYIHSVISTNHSLIWATSGNKLAVHNGDILVCNFFLFGFAVAVLKSKVKAALNLVAVGRFWTHFWVGGRLSFYSKGIRIL